MAFGAYPKGCSISLEQTTLALLPGSYVPRESLRLSKSREDVGLPGEIKRDATIDVSYDGEPQFEPIEETSMRDAVNTESQVNEADATGEHASVTAKVV